jgi:hypothetical protein
VALGVVSGQVFKQLTPLWSFDKHDETLDIFL